MNVAYRPTDLEKAWMQIVEAAGFSHGDHFTVQHVIAALVGKGITLEQSAKPPAGNYRISLAQIRDLARAHRELGDSDLRYGLNLLERVLEDLDGRWRDL
jgi:hypothetical protein